MSSDMNIDEKIEWTCSQRIYIKIKRCIDIIGALLGLVFVSPLMCIVALLVRIKLGSPVIFKQERPGRNEKSFVMYKFRTMTNKMSSNGELVSDAERMTTIGKMIRKTSLDELPELFNVIKGDMSFIGPRPLLMRYLPYYRDDERKRHAVRPGITGLAQVEGRSFLSWTDRFAIDVKYVENISFVLDLKIFFKTIAVVLGHSGIMEYDKKEDMVFEDLDEERKNEIL